MNLEECRAKANNLFNDTVNNHFYTGEEWDSEEGKMKDFPKGNNYWQIGCVFDTVTDYLQQDAGFDDPRATADIEKVMQETYDHYQSIVQIKEPQYSWYDDFAWWGIACSKAFCSSFKDVFGSLAGCYQRISLSTWEIMKNGKCDHVHFGAPHVWEKCDQKTFAKCEPRFPGGVWQYDIFGELRALEDSPSNPSTPIKIESYDAANLGPFQNTVTNGLYFVLANRLVAAGYERPEAVKAIFGFFDRWFHDESLGTVLSLNQPVQGGQLIRERVSTYKNGDKVHEWHPETAWGGDQGLVLGALAEYKRYNPGPESAWIDQVLNDILGGVAGSMKDSIPGYQYAMPWYPLHGNKLESMDASDYSSGVGVYMRYLSHTYGFDSTVQKVLNEKGNPMRQLILDSAATVLAGKLPNWGSELFSCFNQLAIMVMAISLLKKGNGAE